MKKAYLQIRIDPSLWCYQAVKWRGQIYVLTRMGFGLNVAPNAMTRIVEYVLNADPKVSMSVSSYIDDIYVNESILPMEQVVTYELFIHFWLTYETSRKIGET